MKDQFEEETDRFEREVRALAADLVRAGRAAPFEAIDKARKQIMTERQEKYRTDMQSFLAGKFGKKAS